MEGKEWVKQLKTITDSYKGMHITVNSNPPVIQFSNYLQELENTGNLKSIWVQLNSKQLDLFDQCVNHLNYKIHSGLDKKLVVYKWVSPLTDLVVPYSIFWVAAGAVVIHEGKVLLVQQKSGKRKGLFGLPGGRADRGQLIGQCAQRQLFQQTGIKGKFDRILLIRQLTKDQIYDCVDIYFVCLMKLQENGLAGFTICEREIGGFKWVQLQEYEQFCLKNSIGTQIDAAKHISLLHREGRLFENLTYSKEINEAKNRCKHKL